MRKGSIMRSLFLLALFSFILLGWSRSGVDAIAPVPFIEEKHIVLRSDKNSEVPLPQDVNEPIDEDLAEVARPKRFGFPF
ncbi:hypothetical protein PRIPAC_92561 [Pristionchus pacificus]|uniref:Uncharacterized protein n=1 Tax=Pristionchus pacificus TaxID=54126 RepID=A0A2A6BPW0_PRIPA|nr:hypothetical protein PRIPAC_92561 [Pristionchus pacificus]|eukprot:PDM67940.1 hypothetical protein PRIPAC_45984 [Pristionchus pacificus]